MLSENRKSEVTENFPNLITTPNVAIHFFEIMIRGLLH